MRPPALVLATTLASLATLACTGLGADSSAPTGPEIATFIADTDRLSDGGTVTFTALVTDPQGAGDVAGGTLTDAEGGDTYGVFENDGENWTITLSWEDIGGVRALNFDSEDKRTFEAIFVDNSGGESAPATVAVTFHCDGEPSCGGACIDFTADPANCGGCGAQCEAYEAYNSSVKVESGPTCSAGQCVVAADCSNDLQRTCKTFCTKEGYSGCPDLGDQQIGLIFTADPDVCSGDPSMYIKINSCDQDLSDAADVYGYEHMACLCLP